MEKKVFWRLRNKTMHLKNFPELIRASLGREVHPLDCDVHYTILDQKVEWSVRVEDKEDFDSVKSASDAWDAILDVLKTKHGLDLYDDYHFIISSIRMYWNDSRHRIVQRSKLENWVPDKTWFIGNEPDGIYVYESGSKEVIVFDKPQDLFDIDKWIMEYLSKE